MRDMASNSLYQRMKQGEPIIGCKLTSRSPLIAELIGWCGYDYVFIDAEHTSYGIETIENAVRAVQLGGAEPIVRIVGHDPGEILHMLDMGVTGIFVPHVEDGAQARAIMDTAKYYPQGSRGYSNVARVAHFGLIPMEQHRRNAAETVIVAMLESLNACHNVEAILDAGVDALTVGRRDLSESMGFGGELTPEVEAEVEKVRAAAKARNVPLGGSTFAPEDFEHRMDEGCRLFNVTSDMLLLRKALLSALDSFRKEKAAYAARSGHIWRDDTAQSDSK